MTRNRSHMTIRILDLTLEIIYLLTGEVYVPESKPSSHVAPNSRNCVSIGWRKSHSPIMDPPPPSQIDERINDKKILEVIQKMIELLTGEVSGAGNSGT
ncbi:PREDICTED: oocyte zinc finger protein XlCOF29-like [Nanorana parkeri]|uniref:oocyte zinc finger protein XlCOF29-like n=1 Tax=Nanorana parkeri TaxID=125878 RepID=UPI0008541CD1|nr:PREDICTED: oocyte zinc finger protein XlCOF29-like [Nanorana parkeri]